MATVIEGPAGRSLAERFFSAHPFDRGWCRNVLDFQVAHLLVDDIAHPGAAVLRDSRTGFCFAAGNEAAVAGLIDPLMSLLRTASWPLISVASDGWRKLLLAHPNEAFWEFLRVALELSSQNAKRLNHRSVGNREVRPIDLDVAVRLASDLDPDFGVLWPDPADFVAHSFGYCVLDGLRPVSYAVSGFRPARLVCPGIATAETYRGRGLGTRCLAALVRRCGVQGLDVEFCTGAINEPAIAIARKLGFANPRYHSWIGLNKSHRSP